MFGIDGRLQPAGIESGIAGAEAPAALPPGPAQPARMTLGLWLTASAVRPAEAPLIGDFQAWTRHGLSARLSSVAGDLRSVLHDVDASFTSKAWAAEVRKPVADPHSVAISGTVVPRQAIWALVVGGLGALGFGMRRFALR